jgi:hypothetical protein
MLSLHGVVIHPPGHYANLLTVHPALLLTLPLCEVSSSAVLSSNAQLCLATESLLWHCILHCTRRARHGISHDMVSRR